MDGSLATISGHVSPSQMPKRISRSSGSRSRSNVAAGADRLGRRDSPAQIAGQRQVEPFPSQVRGEGLRLRAALIVERDVGLTLETPLRVPRRAPVTDANELHDAAFAAPWTRPSAADFAPATFLMNGPPFVRHQQVVHVVGMLFLGRENPLEHHARGRVLLAEVADQLAIVIDRDPLGDQVLLQHLDEIWPRSDRIRWPSATPGPRD